jgi:hypothetical protein
MSAVFAAVLSIICLIMQATITLGLISRTTLPLRIKNAAIHPKADRSVLLRSRRMVFESEMDLKKMVSQSEMILVIPTSTTVSSGYVLPVVNTCLL